MTDEALRRRAAAEGIALTWHDVWGEERVVSPETLRKSGLAKGIWHEVKILGNGAIAKPLKVSAHHFSASAKEKILAAGGTVTEIPGPAAVAKNKRGTKKASRKKPAAG